MSLQTLYMSAKLKVADDCVPPSYHCRGEMFFFDAPLLRLKALFPTLGDFVVDTKQATIILQNEKCFNKQSAIVISWNGSNWKLGKFAEIFHITSSIQRRKFQHAVDHSRTNFLIFQTSNYAEINALRWKGSQNFWDTIWAVLQFLMFSFCYSCSLCFCYKQSSTVIFETASKWKCGGVGWQWDPQTFLCVCLIDSANLGEALQARRTLALRDTFNCLDLSTDQKYVP